MFIRLSVKSYL